MKNEKDKSDIDARVKTQPISWKSYLFTWFILLILSSGQWMIFAEYKEFGNLPPEYIFGMIGYWAIVSAIFILSTHLQIKKKFDTPVRRLSKAAKKVAEGDFSIFVEPVNTPDKYNYLDVMFEDFNKMVEDLGSIETLTNDFIANVSHEIKTPLAIIQNYAESLQRDDLPDQLRKEYSKTIIDATQKLNTLVTNILRLNKLENQDIIQTYDRYNVCQQLCDCALQFEELLVKNNITFNTEIENKVMLKADEAMMEIVWLNILSNAVKFTDAGGVITMEQASTEDAVIVSISDTGCGMDSDTMRHIFDKFYQGDTSHSGKGNGLGLSLVHRIVTKTGGTLAVTSKPGKGSTFTVTIPLIYF